MAETTLIKKHLTRPLINAGTKENPKWVQVKKATENTRTMNPTTEERDYISDEQPTTELTGYKPSESYGVTTYKGEPDFELFYKLYKERAIGSDAKREFLYVHLFEKITVGNQTMYYAEKTDSTIAVDDFNTVGTVIDVTVYENGTPERGYVTISESGEVTFTANENGLPEFELLTEEPSDWEDNYTNYFVGISPDEYAAISGDTAPEFVTETYYKQK